MHVYSNPDHNEGIAPCSADEGMDREQPDDSVGCPNLEGDVIRFSYSQGEPCKQAQNRRGNHSVGHSIYTKRNNVCQKTIVVSYLPYN
jgi:hypothetical protein